MAALITPPNQVEFQAYLGLGAGGWGVDKGKKQQLLWILAIVHGGRYLECRKKEKNLTRRAGEKPCPVNVLPPPPRDSERSLGGWGGAVFLLNHISA